MEAAPTEAAPTSSGTRRVKRERLSALDVRALCAEIAPQVGLFFNARSVQEASSGLVACKRLAPAAMALRDGIA